MRNQAEQIIREAIGGVLPDVAVQRALEKADFPGRVILVAAGKAAWQMARAARKTLGSKIEKGIVITKYGHVMGPIQGLLCREAGHPVPDENSFSATREALELTRDLRESDTVLFLLSGGGSALFEVPLIPGAELQDITGQLLASGAEITQINTLRKRLSAVKGGKFALHCAPARVFSVVLSDIIGDPLDMIASGPAYPDSSTCSQALEIAQQYHLRLSEQAWQCLKQENPKQLTNVTTCITGSVRELCTAAAEAARKLGYEPRILTDTLSCEAKDAGVWLAGLARECSGKAALIAGGETVVKLTGQGKGGRNQELALAAAPGIRGLAGVCIFSIGSDGTDGPTDAAGGYVDGSTAGRLEELGLEVGEILHQNDAYHALEKVGGLLFTGPTGTNVNDVAVALIDK